MYIAGAGIFAVAIGALLYSRCDGDDASPPATQPVSTAASATATPEPALPEYAPPPPPEEEEGEGGGDEGKEKADPKPAPKSVAGGPAGGGACGKCGEGTPSAALRSAVSQTMGLARGCYNRALRGNAGEGRIVVSVSVGSDGSLCGARLASNTTGNAALGACVLGKFQGRSYPPPDAGCVVVNAPINFSMKQ
ncbi:MAG: AgmX/PglI C-terminal domain-containing protein [Myxococcota bacterium]